MLIFWGGLTVYWDFDCWHWFFAIVSVYKVSTAFVIFHKLFRNFLRIFSSNWVLCFNFQCFWVITLAVSSVSLKYFKSLFFDYQSDVFPQVSTVISRTFQCIYVYLSQFKLCRWFLIILRKLSRDLNKMFLSFLKYPLNFHSSHTSQELFLKPFHSFSITFIVIWSIKLSSCRYKFRK